MTSDQDAELLKQLRERLHQLHGNRIGVMRQELSGSDAKAAHQAAAKARAYRQVLHLLDEFDREGEFPAVFPDATADQYARVSEAVLEADDAASERQDAESRRTRYHD